MKPGEVWQVDLGMAGKVRPCLLLTGAPFEDELALVTVVPHTTALRGNHWELPIPKSFLKAGAFHFQQIQSLPMVRLMRKLGELKPEEMAMVKDRIRERFEM
ncbi:type II toxin-antitoxin system PemK/MazF family toxin [Luteolibacter flavescens]|uniref:Type II toxin-antitoxin system PemK/MazF family toxin n=1 Tax=Luteolibacter flavescens TaxID=1859460 RepID=A0ABT3FMH5_9BACT|nr:type II toxin-antitoxin system PemK/MazF family toxin [Luteolibacter flavescens]MCW1884775.1 type II toxin-antitoxin system PemK/MazF family toxin [Luteolibacter flavescens]